MYSINLSMSHTEIPQNYICNLKQLSESVVRVQLAERSESDSLPVVHSNSRTFAQTHPSALTVDVTMSHDVNAVVVKPKNFDATKVSSKVSDLFVSITRSILKLNNYETTEGYTSK